MVQSKRYRQYIHSEAWRRRRLVKLEAAKHRCEYCGDVGRLSVHHLTYERLGCEYSSDLIVLCTPCHWVADEMRKNPDCDLRQRYEAPQKPKPEMSREERKIEQHKRQREGNYHYRFGGQWASRRKRK